MTPHPSRPVLTRICAVLLTVVLALAGGTLPAFADELEPAPVPVVETSPAPDEEAPIAPADGEEEAPVEPPAEAVPVATEAPEPEPTVAPAEEPASAPLATRTAIQAAAPTLVVSKTTGLDPSGETVTVSGSGYNPAQPMYLILCADIPLEDVTFAFAAGCTTGAKQITNDPTTATMVKLEDDGSFTTTFAVSRPASATSGNAIYTVANHTAQTDRTQDAKQVISFRPLLTVSTTAGLDASGETVTVTGSGYNPTQPMYLFVCRDVPLASVDFDFALPCASGAKQVTPNPTTPTMVQLEADGSFTTSFTVSRDPSHATGSAIYTVANHTAMTDRTQDAKRAISFTPLLTVTPDTGLDPTGQTVTVTGAGYNPAQPMYLFVCRDVPVSDVSFAFASGCARGAKQVTNDPTTATMVKLEDDGTFTTTLTVAGDPDFTAGTAIYTAANHTAQADRSQDARRAISFTGPTPTTTTVTAPSSTSTGDPVEVSVTVAPTAAGSVELTGVGSARTADLEADGTAEFTLTGLAAGSYTMTVAFTPTNPLLHGASTGTAQLRVAAPAVTRVGSLAWGVKADFRDYVTGPIAKGTITTSGATSSGGVFGFAQTGGALDGAGHGSIDYGGSVRFSGHNGALDVRFSDPIVRITSAGNATLLVRVGGGSHVAFGDLRLASGVRSVSNGVVTYRGVPAVLTAAGATAFAGFYAAGTALDPVTFSIGAAGSPSGGVRTVSAFVPTGDDAPAATPPATEGVQSPGDEFVEGGTATFTADGFEPGESGILAVIYSEPTVLASDLTADAAGTVTWSGNLPRGLTGEHTFTFQGSVDRGIVLQIAEEEVEVVGCTVEGAELHWGFKESFRAYIDGSIANGEWTTADGATYETPLFSWTGGTGGYDAATGDARLAFTGSVRFTGHGGVLDTTIANPRIVIDGEHAALLLDVSGTTQDGSPVAAEGVEFAQLDLADVEPTGGGDLVALTGIPAVLTAAGADAFGTYPAGEALDTLDLRITVDPTCVSPVGAIGAGGEAASDIATENASAVAAWPWILLGILAALAVAATAVLLVRRSRRA